MKSKDTLTAHREKKSTYNMITVIKDCNNKVKAVLTGYNQPKKTQKTIRIKDKEFNLKFE